MKKLLFLFLLVSLNAFGQINCAFTLTPAGDFFSGTANGVMPGDTICLTAGHYTSGLTINNCIGTPDSNVVVINYGGHVRISGDGVTTDGNQYFQFRGDGDHNFERGILIDSIPGPAMDAGGRTTDYELCYIDFGGAKLPDSFYSIDGFAFRIHQAPTAGDTLLQHPYWFHRNIKVHHNRVRWAKAEGFYIGHSNFEGVTVDYGEGNVTALPPRLRGVWVHDNDIAYTGWDGFQVSNSDSISFIYSNKIRYAALAHKPAQGVGLVIGGGTENAYVYDNNIANCEGAGIHLFGINLYVYLNKISNCGFSVLTGSGIFIGSKYVASTPVSFIELWENSITNVNGPGIDNNHQYYNTAHMHRIENNNIQHPAAGNYINFQGGVSRNRWILMDNTYVP